jgi:hypothetical protein
MATGHTDTCVGLVGARPLEFAIGEAYQRIPADGSFAQLSNSIHQPSNFLPESLV